MAETAIAMSDDSLAFEVLRAVQIDGLPRFAFHCHRIGRIYLALDDFVSAERYLTLARDLKPQSIVTLRLLGSLFRAAGRTDDAVACFRAAASAEVNTVAKVRAISSAATALADAGRKDVESVYREILQIDPDNPHAIYGLVESCSEIDSTSATTQHIRELIISRSVTTPAKADLHFAMAIIEERSNSYGSAFAHLVLANRIRAAASPAVSLANKRKQAARRRAVFTRDTVARLSTHGCQQDVLICIVGMPRSGTSLTEQILGSHSGVTPLGERNEFHRLSTALPLLLRTKLEYPECCKRLSSSQIIRLSQMIFDRMRRCAGPSGRIVTKLPEDFFNLGMISILFPRVRIIHCMRNPLDTCLSCFQQNFKHVPYARDLYELADAYRVYQDMMVHWRSVLPATSLLDVVYEDLVRSPETVVRRILEFAGLEYQESCLRFHQSARPVRTMSRWQVRQSIYQSAVGRSSAYREFLGPLMELDGVEQG